MRYTGLIVVIYIVVLALLCMTACGIERAVISCKTAVETARQEREYEQKRSDNYAAAVSFLQSGDYGQARKRLEYLWDYKDGEVLLAYARARSFFQETNYYAYYTFDYLNKIPADYSGEFADEIAAFRVEAEKRRPELQALYDAEQERWAERERQLAKQLEEIRAKAATYKTPFEGLSRDLISYTQLGPYDCSEQRNGAWFYYWKNGGIPFYVCVQDDRVVYTSESKNRQSGSSVRSRKSSDPYNVDDYSHADDFYYDHWDDFVDYADAEDYYDSHQ